MNVSNAEGVTVGDDKCGMCDGAGFLWSEKDPKNAGLQVKVTCPSCGGSGKK